MHPTPPHRALPYTPSNSALWTLHPNGGSCYGDFCHYECIGPTNGGSISGENDSLPVDGMSPASKLVSYRSILKCRAEEKALLLRPETQGSAGRGVLDHHLNVSVGEDSGGAVDPTHRKVGPVDRLSRVSVVSSTIRI